MSFDLRNIIVYLFGLLLIFVFFRLLKKPLAWVFRLVISCVVGIAALALFNLIFAKAGVSIPLNPFNAVTAGILGIPGIVFLWVLGSII